MTFGFTNWVSETFDPLHTNSVRNSSVLSTLKHFSCCTIISIQIIKIEMKQQCSPQGDVWWGPLLQKNIAATIK